MRRLKICSMAFLPALKPACSSAWLQSVQYDLQHDFAWVTDEACLVVLALLHVAFLRKCDDQRLGQQSWPFSCLPHLVADCHDSSDNILSTCLDQFCLCVSSPDLTVFLYKYPVFMKEMQTSIFFLIILFSCVQTFVLFECFICR